MLLDRYILRQFVQTFLFGVLAFVVIYIAVDIMEKLGKFYDNNVAGSIILKYYLYAIPDIVQLIVPIGTLLASLFTIGRLDQTHELTAMRAAGRSMKRIAAPILLFGLLVSGFMIYFNGWIVPVTNKERYAIERKYLEKSGSGAQYNVFKRISPTLNLLINFFDPSTGQATTVALEHFDTAARVPVNTIHRKSASEVEVRTDTAITIRITERIDAATMRYDTTRKLWILQNGTARNLTNPELIGSTPFTEREINFLPITPQELNLSQQNVKELTLGELRERIEQERLGGRDVEKLLIDYYSRFAFPFSAFIVVFFGIPFSSAQRKSGAAMQIAVTALVSALYMVLNEVSKTFTYGTNFPPELTAWMSNIVFCLIGVFNLFRIERG